MSIVSQNKKTAEVIGVFSKAVYCECEGEILVFHGSEWGHVPFGIAVDGIEAFVKSNNFAVGEKVAVTRIVGKKELERAVLSPLSVERLDAVRKIIEAEGSRGGILEYIDKNLASCRDNTESLYHALCKNDPAAAEYAVKLIGLGRGLTPSGDDFLCGMFSLFFAAEKSGMSLPDAVGKCAKAVEKNLSRTSKISAAYLGAVLRDEYFTVYDRAARALLGDGEIKPHTDIVLSLGASSGTDTLCGALFAARVLQRSGVLS